jgi:hypothetical protein
LSLQDYQVTGVCGELVELISAAQAKAHCALEANLQRKVRAEAEPNQVCKGPAAATLAWGAA